MATNMALNGVLGMAWVLNLQSRTSARLLLLALSFRDLGFNLSDLRKGGLLPCSRPMLTHPLLLYPKNPRTVMSMSTHHRQGNPMFPCSEFKLKPRTVQFYSLTPEPISLQGHPTISSHEILFSQTKWI